MVLKFLLRYFANNEQLIQRLSESYPIRRAAQITIFMFARSKELFEIFNSRNFRDISNLKQTSQRLRDFPKRLKHELKEGFRQANEEQKKGKQ
ncbi:protein NCBP2AS2 homolog [Centruroides vittatus]|uniref:protein NCBP2AS2 homolog n=1 Tax=Centruroides vittatus TaxID=120091 RepID=UPI0035108796